MIQNSPQQNELIIFYAGSLSKPLNEIEEQFIKIYPTINIKHEIGGSTQLANFIIKKEKKADIFISADFEVINSLLIPNFTNYNICFASNQIVLCYTQHSKFKDNITENNWYKILQNPHVKWAHTNPNFDPCGYRSLMTLQLAELFYHEPNLFKNLLSRQTNYICSNSNELIQMLKNNIVDYIWEYKSVAIQNNFNFITLNEKINLSNHQFNAFYNNAKIITNTPQNKTKIQIGKSIIYGITQIKDCLNPINATKFLEFFLSPQYGMKILHNHGQPIFSPPFVFSQTEMNTIPKTIKSLITYIS